ncbi:hypothetical protein GWK47_019925 [Chionoecetes opilio]|uniref:Uncharacterized protein n=1 Tax=Chionoecetes opilio TaxID=41210 RepID=A0A8J4XTS0_CHIOP|nr:hypothetical protein GWK47_019925 [Chionoecetes opilio]
MSAPSRKSVSSRKGMELKSLSLQEKVVSEQVDQRKSNVDGVAIGEKARSIYDHLAEKEPSGPPLPPGLLPAMGVFHRFKQRFKPAQKIARTVLYIKMSAPSRKGVSSRKGMELKSLSLQEKVKVLARMDASASMRAIVLSLISNPAHATRSLVR